MSGTGTLAGTDASVFRGDGEMAARCRATDWAATPLGAVDRWPPALRTAVRLMLATPIATSLWCGPAYTLLYNDAYRRILGVKHPAALGRSGADVWEELWPALQAQFDTVRAGGAPVFADEALLVMARLEDGSEDAWFTYSLSALTDDAGECLAIYNLAVETTERVRARGAAEAANAQLQEQALELELANQQLQENGAELEVQAEELQEASAQLEARTREAEAATAYSAAILEGMADAHFTLDAGFRFVSMNRAQERNVGLPRERLLGRTLWEVFPETLGTQYERHYRAVAEDRVAAHFVHDYADDRFAVVAEVDVYPAPDGGIAVFWRDITARRRVEVALRESEAKYRTLFESLDAGFCVIEMLFDDAGRPVDYRFVETNPAFVQQTGLVDAVGRTARELVPELEPHWFEAYGRVARTGEPARFENGSEPMQRWFDVFAFRAGAAEERRVAVLFTDVSAAKSAGRERERLLADAEAARAEAESANRAKGEFLAVMSHELRTPLNAIGGYAELIEIGVRGPVTPEQQADLERIQRAQRHLLGLINGVLNYTRVEAGAVHYDLEEVPLHEALATCEALTAPQLRGQRLEFHHAACDRSLRAWADREKLQQVLLNLITNAVKFTEPGGRVELACHAAERVVRITVTDTGRGIAPDQLAHVFEPFVQIDTRLTRTQDGVGLGLAISRDLARGMGGDLTAESTPGAGSTFTLTLPRGGGVEL